MKALAVDTETTGTNLRHGAQVFAISACDDRGKTWFWDWPVDPFTRQVQYKPTDTYSAFTIQDFRYRLSRYDKWVFHNAKFDLYGLSKVPGLKTLFGDRYLRWSKIEDTMLMSHVVNSLESHGLKDLGIKYLDILDDDQKNLRTEIQSCRREGRKLNYELSEHVWWDSWLPKCLDPKNNQLEDYCIRDSVRTIQLAKVFQKILEDQELLRFYQDHKDLLKVVYRMESIGVPVKPASLKQAAANWSDSRSGAEEKAGRIAGGHFEERSHFNVRSTKQLQAVLYKGMGFLAQKVTPGGVGSVDQESLSLLLDQPIASSGKPGSKEQKSFVQAILDYRKADTACKYLAGYKELMLRDGSTDCLSGPRLYPFANQIGTHTTRFSYSNPNLQNVSLQAEIPLRKVFGPTKGTFWYDVDYNQLELRILAVAANETKMLEAFRLGVDIHQWTADLCGIPRKQGKFANFAAVYGAGNWKLEQMTGIPNMGKIFREAYPEIAAFTHRTIHTAETNGFVETLGGYPLVVPPDRLYAAVDYVIQGTAGEIVKKAMVKFGKLLPRKYPGVEMILNVHDELLFEVPNGYRYRRDLPFWLADVMVWAGGQVGVYTPVTVKIVRSNWASPKEVKL